MEYQSNDGSVVTPELIEGYLAEARQAYVSSKEAAARSAAYIYMTWKAALAPWAKQADKDTMADAITAYDKEVQTFNTAIETLKKNAAKLLKNEIKPEDLDTNPSLTGDGLEVYQKLVALVRSGKTFDAKDYRKVTASSHREGTSPFAVLVKFVLGLDRPEDSSTVSRYVSVVSFLHSSAGAKTANDASEFVKLIEGVGGFERAVQWKRGNNPPTAKQNGNKAEKAKAIAAEVKKALENAPSKGVVTMDVFSAKDGLVVLVGRCSNGKVDVIGELPVSNMEKTIASYQDEALFPVAPMTHFLGRVMSLGKLVEEGRLTGRTVDGTAAGEKQKEQRTLTLVPTAEGRAKLTVSALYADASVVVTAVPHHKDIALGMVSSASMLGRDGYLALDDDVVDIIERRLVTVTAHSAGGKLSWSLKNTAIKKKDGSVEVKEFTWTDLTGKFTTPLAVEGFRPKFTVQMTKRQVAEVLTSRYANGEAQKKAVASDEAFDMEFVGDAFSARTLGQVGEPGGAGAKEPVGIRCRECDAHGLLTALTSQKADAFTFEGDPRGLLAVSWTDDVGSYKVFVPARMSDGGLNPSRLAPLEVTAAEEPVAA
ncbi:MAG: hypothetical protein WCN98_02115 [Verrucomicrobiaceae bacterium]